MKRVLCIAEQSFAFLAFAFPATQSLIADEPLAKIVGRLAVHLIRCALVSLVIAAGIKLSYAYCQQRARRKRASERGNGAEPMGLRYVPQFG
ncbi:hypothetical protein JW848_03690 [Candidatus Bipolaricaulota bacterium]|nr:hypothetical protein [Candidatus Bipolaricaulota bacterium]